MQVVLISGILLVLASLILLKLLILRHRLWIGICFIIILFFGLILIFIGYCVAPYRIFQEEKPVVLIEARLVKAEIYDLTLSLKHFTFPQSLQPEKFLLTGNQWAIEGNIIKIKLNGKRVNLYRITHIRSRFVNPANLRQSPELAYNLSERSDIFWDFLSRHRLSFIEAFSGNSNYRNAAEYAEFYLYAGSGGFRLAEK